MAIKGVPRYAIIDVQVLGVSASKEIGGGESVGVFSRGIESGQMISDENN